MFVLDESFPASPLLSSSRNRLQAELNAGGLPRPLTKTKPSGGHAKSPRPVFSPPGRHPGGLRPAHQKAQDGAAAAQRPGHHHHRQQEGNGPSPGSLRHFLGGDEGLTSPAEAVGCLGSERGSSCWRPARANTAALLLFLNLTLFLAEANPKQNPAEPGKSLPGLSKTFKLLKPEEGMGFGPQYTA